ncbi:glycosyltransferase [Lactobacillus helveticus]|uniref:glycosyltransferase n=2 Tax=Lactobacillus helveticus TaxID=1587 RepID=UPI0021C30999|nr:glycosyltransferase [Lactobacillus helveticus]MCP9317787.1 glycosyltransferase [Lactobacillus helveticus]MDH5818100.1 glycosyltransferase [Lactobacillus helveticus]
MPLVSVIMSVFNVKKYEYLLNSVNSILNQTYKNFEFIICDDKSTDNTLQVLKEIAKKDNRIKIISNKQNMGLGASLNHCLKFARGKYIARMDDDDFSKKERLEKEVNFLDKHPEYSFVGTIANVFDKNKIWGTFRLPEKPQKSDFLWNSPFLNPSMMFRADALKAVHGFRVTKETRRAEDYDLFFRLYAKGYKGYNIQEILFNYRIDIENEKHKKYRPMKDRINEAKVRYGGFKALHLGYRSIPYVIKPIIIGLIPAPIFYEIRKKQYR